jgi:hypothetical protein
MSIGSHWPSWVSALMGAVLALFLYLMFTFRDDPVVPWLPAVVAVILLASWWMVSVLITRVDAAGVSWSFAWGWPGGRISFDRISRVERTQLNLLERGSAGLHWTIWHGWLWNVAGAEAVEIFLTSGNRVTIGTNDPQGLLDAIETAREAVEEKSR